MKILVTGGLGFIGSNFIRYMLNKYLDYSIVNMDVITYAGNPANLEDMKKKTQYHFFRGDISNETHVRNAAKDIDIIINFAAETHVDRSITHPENFVRTNFVGTHVLLEYARKHDIECYFQISSDEVYGSIQSGSFTETDALNPSSAYAASKAGADLLVKAYHKTYGLPILIARSSNNFGPYQYPEKLIPYFITRILQNKPLPIYGDGLNVRDWIFVEDNCAAIDTILHKGTKGEIYNVGAGNEKTNLEVTRFILKELGKTGDFIEYVKDRPAHDRRYSLDTAKIRGLEWKPTHSFQDALRKTIDWYVQNESWWRPLLKSA